MDAQELLDQLLTSGKKLLEQGLTEGAELAAKGKEMASEGADFAKERFRIPADGPERDRMLTHLGAGAAAGGILALLLGTNRGRNTLSQVAKVSSLAALGALGYKAYSEYQKDRGKTVHDSATMSLTDVRANQRCLTIVRAMIAAAKADGVIDAQERRLIEDRIRESDLDRSVIDTLLAEIAKPLVVADVAKLAFSPIECVDIYLASRLIVDDANEKEKLYLAELANVLQLDSGLVQRLNQEAFNPI